MANEIKIVDYQTQTPSKTNEKSSKSPLKNSKSSPLQQSPYTLNNSKVESKEIIKELQQKVETLEKRLHEKETRAKKDRNLEQS